MFGLSILVALLGAEAKKELQYRANFFILCAMGLVFQATGIVFIWVLLSRFESIGGWTLGEIAFVYGLRLISHGLWWICCGWLGFFDYVIRQGEFDRFLLRPVPLMLQVMGARFRPNQLGDIATGVGLLFVANGLVGIDWSAASVVYLVGAVLGGALVEGGMVVLIAASAFRLLNTGALSALVNDMFDTFGGYPLTIYGEGLRALLTFVVPVAFVAYFPASVVLGRTSELSVPIALAYLAPVAGAALFAAASVLWHREVRSYQSAGH